MVLPHRLQRSRLHYRVNNIGNSKASFTRVTLKGSVRSDVTGDNMKGHVLRFPWFPRYGDAHTSRELTLGVFVAIRAKDKMAAAMWSLWV